jgi:hypothetical protein
MSSHEERLELFGRGALEVERLERDWPELSWLASVKDQLDYLRAIERGDETDRSRLAEVNIGVIAAKELEDRDPAAAEVLHRVAGAAREMQTLS